MSGNLEFRYTGWTGTKKEHEETDLSTLVRSVFRASLEIRVSNSTPHFLLQVTVSFDMELHCFVVHLSVFIS
jgi:hypothetical protein